MFGRILIANRGEIACRIIRTARRMGVGTVAVYSEADAEARHVRLADETFLLGPAAPAESYLAVDRILAAARRSGAEAVHPGYGFLAENADFAEACAGAGLVFIGPPIEALRVMGAKAAARAIMQRAGVPVVPGYHGDAQDPELLQEEAGRIGYPILIKASAGGGGKGMRLVEAPAEFVAALQSCRREAMASFGDDRVILEKALARPRHVEIQIFADVQGSCIHLFERDCSIQRRHQKVVEEAPAPGLGAARRAEMGAAAIAAAEAVGYVGAGTVEFITDPDGSFHFIEMNTRLQVEHPVTELITGLDLVEWQLRIASGEALPLAQEQLAIHGHALEARVSAEDPTRGFLPSTGRLVHLALPEDSLHVRVDSGVEQGDVIGPDYDPMIAKVIVWDETRQLARARLLQSLAQCRIVGVANNVEFLARLVGCPAFARADLDTGLIERERAFLFAEPDEVPSAAWLVATLATLLREDARARALAERDPDPFSPWHRLDGWRLGAPVERRLVFRHGEIEKLVLVGYARDGYRLTLDGATTFARGELGPNATLRVELDGMRLDAAVVIAGEKRHVFLHGRGHSLVRVDPLHQGGEGARAEGVLVAPMPGRIVALLAEPEARVSRGAPLLTMEAMKMEHTLTAPAAGRVRTFHFAVGEQVSEGVELLQFEPEGSDA